MIHQIRTKAAIYTKVIDRTWICTLVFIILKSMLFLAMLHSANSAGLNIGKMYFSPPPFITQSVFIVLLLSPAILLEGRTRFTYYMIVDALISVLLVGDLWYYRSNGNFLSIRFLFSPELFNPLNKTLINPYPMDILFIADLFVVTMIYKKIYIYDKIKKSKKFFAATSFFCIAFISISHYLIDELDVTRGSMMLFRNCWAPFQTMSNLSPIGYHGFDIYRQFSDNRKMMLSESDFSEIVQWFEDKQEKIPDNEYKSIFKGKNLIAVQVESLENFVIGRHVYGQEITPNLNKLLNNSLYFNNIHEQNNGGTSSDADLLVNTSMYPVRKGATFLRYPAAQYISLPKLLKDEGYQTVSTHPEIGGNWNWAEAHKAALNFQTILDVYSYNTDEKIGQYISDGSLLRQFEEKLKYMKHPFYGYLVTLTSHGPFEIPSEYRYLELPEELDKTILGAYFQSIRYVDEQIGLFIKLLEKDGILKDSVVMIYGDHTGIHKYYNDEIQGIELEGDWWKVDDKKIPLIIFNPEITGREVETVGGHIDIMPTIAYMFGINEEKFSHSSIGKILVKTGKNFTVLNKGEIIGTPGNNTEKDHMVKGIEISDRIIRGNFFAQSPQD